MYCPQNRGPSWNVPLNLIITNFGNFASNPVAEFTPDFSAIPPWWSWNFAAYNSLWNFNQVLKSVHWYSSSRSRRFWLSSHLSSSITFPGVKRHRPLHLFLLRLHHSISLFLGRLLSRQTSSLRLFFWSYQSHTTTPSIHSLAFKFCHVSRFVLFPSFFRGRTEVDRASCRKLILPLSCFKTEVVSLYFNSLQFIWSRRRCHFVGNPGPPYS